jgi:hyperosmotically inducible periplasmic protein
MALIRMFFRVVVTLVLVAGALLVYHLYRSGSLPYFQEALEEATVVGSVKAAFAIHKDLAHRTIRVEAEGGRILLQGGVGSAAERIEAEKLASTVEGVESVENRLEIDPELLAKKDDPRSLGQKIDDVALLAKVRTALRLDRETRRADVELSVESGVVRVSGRVSTEALKERVCERIRAIEGVEKLEDEIEIE